MFATLLSIFLIVFVKLSPLIVAHHDESGLFSENDGQIFRTNSRDDLMKFDSIHESGGFNQRNVRQNSEKKYDHYKKRNAEFSSDITLNRKKRSEEDSHHDSSSWHFGYKNIDEWGQHFPDCLGKRQSPINLDSRSMTRLRVPSSFVWNGYTRTPKNMTIVNNGHSSKFFKMKFSKSIKIGIHLGSHAMTRFRVPSTFVLTGYTRTPKNMTIVNNGHSIELSGSWNGEEPPYISRGVLKDNYIFHQLHFHWGRHNNVGSEHTINNHSLPLEMHMVHYKKEYGSASEAMKHGDGLAVVGILFKISGLRNRGIAALQKYTGKLKSPGNPIQIRPFPLSLFKLDFPGEYVTYLGSLTTPPCSEIVTWILPAFSRFLSQSQMDNFRSIELAGKDDHNFRPTMPLNGRMIYYTSLKLNPKKFNRSN